MKFSNKTIAYNVYAKIGKKLAQIPNVKDLKLPSIESQTDTQKGAGILGEIDWPGFGQIGSMSFELNASMPSSEALTIIAPGVQEFEVRWAVDKFDSNNVKIGVEAHKVFIKGICKKHDEGKVETAGTMDIAQEYEAFYYRHIIEGKEVLLIDKFNYIYKVKGKDYMSYTKSVL